MADLGYPPQNAVVSDSVGVLYDSARKVVHPLVVLSAICSERGLSIGFATAPGIDLRDPALLTMAQKIEEVSTWVG